MKNAIKQEKKKNNYKSWNKGLTKETSDSLKIVSSKVSKAKKGKPSPTKGTIKSDESKLKQSQTMKQLYKNNEIVVWNKGLTKETNESVRKISEALMGHEPHWSQESVEKGLNTKRIRHTFNTSDDENNYYNYLLNIYSENDILREYNLDSRYPFRCDFYIKSEDLFIEYNGTTEHHGHPFNPNNKEDLEELKYLQQKALEKGSNSRYWNIIKWWTEIDPLKLKILRDNNLNFMLIYPNDLIIDK